MGFMATKERHVCGQSHQPSTVSVGITSNQVSEANANNVRTSGSYAHTQGGTAEGHLEEQSGHIADTERDSWEQTKDTEGGHTCLTLLLEHTDPDTGTGTAPSGPCDFPVPHTPGASAFIKESGEERMEKGGRGEAEVGAALR